MKKKILLNDISIRTELQPGDIGYVIHMHGSLYGSEYNYGVQFETYVAKGLCEFYEKYDPQTNRVWICEHNNRIVGFLLLMDRGEAAQLRYFLIEPEYRGIGLGSKLLKLYMDFLHECEYKESYLWTTHELPAAASLYRRLGFKLTEKRINNLRKAVERTAIRFNHSLVQPAIQRLPVCKLRYMQPGIEGNFRHSANMKDSGATGYAQIPLQFDFFSDLTLLLET